MFLRRNRAAARPFASVFDQIVDLSLVSTVLVKIVLSLIFENPIVSFRPRQLSDAGHGWPDAVWLDPFDQATEHKLLDRAIRA